MTEHFVTLFNNLFLPQGMALHRSMTRNVGNFCLWIICVDETTFNVLEELKLKNTRLLLLSDLETPELLRVKEKRTIVEYCWTLTPFAPKFVFEAAPKVNRVTYLDADLWIIRNPEIILEEFKNSKKSVLITEHAYAPEYDQSETAGIYCVQFMTFERGKSEPIRKWWEKKCIEWCFARSEDGKFGDQKYLDDWATRFSKSVHILQDKELALAPWNASRFPSGKAVFYHFHGTKIISETHLHSGYYRVPRIMFNRIYKPYFSELKECIISLKNVGYEVKTQTPREGFLLRNYRMIKTLFQALSSYTISAKHKL